MDDYHEPPQELSGDTRDLVRALMSLKEEIEAIDWYQQRISVTGNNELKEILAHNQHEEMEHAAMSLEWLRRVMPGWDEALRAYLFTDKDIVQVEEKSEGTADDSDDDTSGDAGNGSLGVGSMKSDGR